MALGVPQEEQDLYKNICENKDAGPETLCFTFWKGSLNTSNNFWNDDHDKIIAIKDDNRTDFGIDNRKGDSVGIYWENNDVQLSVDSYRKNEKVWTITMIADSSSHQRLWISDDFGHVYDTKKDQVTTGQVQGPWVHVKLWR